MSSDTPYSTFVDSGTYSAGRIILADDGRMIFSDDGEVRIILDDVSETDPVTATFKGPRQDEGFDFNCIKNWERVDGNVVTSPPCSGDDVILEREKSYYFFVNDEVPIVPLNAMRYDDNTAITNANLPTYTFDTGMTDRLTISPPNDDFNCPYLDVNQNCICINTCPSESEALAQNANILNVLKAQAQTELDRRADVETHPFTATANFGVSAIQGLTLDTATVATFLGHVSQLSTTVTSASGTSSITLSGSITAPRGAFARPSDDIFTFMTSDGDWTTTLPMLGDDDQAALHKMLNAALYMTSVNQALTAGVDCSTDNLVLCQHATVIYSLFADGTSTMNTLCPSGSCGESAMIRSTLDLEMRSNLGKHLSKSALAPIFDMLAAGLANTNPDAAALSTFQTNGATASSIVNSVAAPAMGSVTLEIASLFPDLFRYHLANSRNAEGIQAVLPAILADMGPIVDAMGFDLMFSVDSRRRAVMGDPNTLTTTFNYTKAGTSAMSDALKMEVNRRIDTRVSARSVFTDTCLSIETMTFNEQCLAVEAVSNVSPSAGQPAFVDYIRNRVKCDARGPMPNGDCYGPNPDADAIAQRVGADAFAQAQDNTRTAGSSGSDDSGNNVGIIAGAAAGGVVLIAAVAFVLLRRRGGNPAAAKQQDRSVVAFNNPLYDESGNVAEEAYDNPVPGDDGGIYDEPAFNGNAKNNPMYDSNDNLADEGGEGYLTTEGVPEGGDGYLETDPAHHQDGYVDTEPADYDNFNEFDEEDDGDETGGYLDVGEGEEGFGDEDAGGDEDFGGFDDDE
eukprot:TRINITY_DN11055_c0_g1_i2.p1 TRINITY_DN11055_c0_g1~~TRINITY_DN11055_c0_g1_i2.p1  ORF type:complete len:854 (+),score=302.59 TRINITY_DN11055_c0_g1_i2:175-2562(+)